MKPTEQERERAKVEQGARPGYIAELEAVTLSSDKMRGIFGEVTTEGSERDADHD